jgi:uncharacterized protein (DUF305 family)
MKKHEPTSMQHHDDTNMMDIMKEMNQKMGTMKMSGDTDHEFAEMMVTHHQAAVDMAQLELTTGNDATLKTMATKMIEDQSREINELKQWLQQHRK